MENKYLDYVESFENFPKEGVIFWDFVPLLKDPKALKNAIADIKNHFKEDNITKIAAIESKGFTIGSTFAYEMNLPLILIRKSGLIPGWLCSLIVSVPSK